MLLLNMLILTATALCCITWNAYDYTVKCGWFAQKWNKDTPISDLQVP